MWFGAGEGSLPGFQASAFSLGPHKLKRALFCFSYYMCVLSHVQLFTSLWTIAHQAPLSKEVSRQEHWCWLPRPASGHLPKPEIEPTSLIPPALVRGFFTTSAT